MNGSQSSIRASGRKILAVHPQNNLIAFELTRAIFLLLVSSCKYSRMTHSRSRIFQQSGLTFASAPLRWTRRPSSYRFGIPLDR